MSRPTTVDEYIERHPEWQAALEKLRRALNAAEFRKAGLEETIKWGAPCYTLQGKNLIGLGAFKSYVGLWFHQGVLLRDPERVLINAGEGKTKALRQWRFGAAREIPVNKVKSYIRETVGNQLEGREVKPLKKETMDVPPELAAALRGDRVAGRAFKTLPPGKQREYAEFITSAKKAATKETRIAKALPLIRAGSGLNDRYRRR